MKKQRNQILKEWGKASIYVAAMFLISVAASHANPGALEGQLGKFKTLLFGDIVAIVFGLAFAGGATFKLYEGDLAGAGKCALIAVIGSVGTSMISGGTIFNALK